VGLAAAALGAQVTLTDLPAQLPIIEGNIGLNAGLLQQAGGSAAAQVLDWAHPSGVAAPPVDYIIGGWPRAGPITSAPTLLQPRPGGSAALRCTLRRGAERAPRLGCSVPRPHAHVAPHWLCTGGRRATLLAFAGTVRWALWWLAWARCGTGAQALQPPASLCSPEPYKAPPQAATWCTRRGPSSRWLGCCRACWGSGRARWC
jgi:hypothetical protein